MCAMTMQIPRGDYVPTSDRRILMGVKWEGYERMLEIRGKASRPRMSYLDGALELMTTSEEHERIKSFITHVVAAYMQEVGPDYVAYGEWTMRDELKEVGIEADEC